MSGVEIITLSKADLEELITKTVEKTTLKTIQAQQEARLESEKVLSPKGVASHFRVSNSTVWAAMDAGQLPYHCREGSNHRKVRFGDAVDWIETVRNKGAETA
jgi:hypothetical protein